MYKVTITVGAETKVLKEESFVAAINLQEGASQVMSMVGFTRHNAINGIVRHTNFVGDLYNEGSVVLEPIV